MIWLLIFFGLLLLGVAAWLVLIGLRESRGVDPLQERLAEYVEKGEFSTLEEIELSQPFMERVVYPAAQRFGQIAQRFTPQNAITETQLLLERANSPKWLVPTLFLSSRLVAGVLMMGIILLVFSLSPNNTILSLRSLFLTLFMGLIGFFLPTLLIKRRISRRQRGVLNAMPDALDLLTICVEAGLGFDAAMKKVVQKWQNELSTGFARVLQEIQLGKLRREALRDMSNRLGVMEMDSFVAAVIQSEQMGVSMAHVLRVQSDAMRIKRRQRAEENAQKAPIKMLIPLAFLIFPTIMIILLGPAILQIMRSSVAGGVF
jgi:tight adherence protein C